MRKPIHERSTEIKLHEISDDKEGVLPLVYLDGDAERFTIELGSYGSRTRGESLTIYDIEAARELRDQLDAWIAQHDD